MKKIFSNLHPMIGALIVCLVMIAVRQISIQIVKSATDSETIHHDAYAQDGYETQAAYWDVYASYAKAWADASRSAWAISIWAGLAMCFLPFAWVAKMDGTLGGGPAYVLWLIGILMLVATFLPLAVVKHKVEYQTKVCEATYNASPTKNFDNLFPAKSLGKLGDFLKTCK